MILLSRRAHRRKHRVVVEDQVELAGPVANNVLQVEEHDEEAVVQAVARHESQHQLAAPVVYSKVAAVAAVVVAVYRNLDSHG